MRKSYRGVGSLLLVVVAGSAAFTACVCDDRVASSDAGSSPTTTSTNPVPTSTGTGTSAPDGATPVDAEADTAIAPLLDAAPDGTTLIDGAPTDASKPMPTCRTPAQNPLAFNLRCAAAPSNPTPGGRIQNGTYVLNGAFGPLFCPSAYIFGSAEVFSQDGEQFLRYNVLRKTSTTDVGTAVSGTHWLNYDAASGRMRVEEMCDPVRKGNVRTGEVSVQGADLVLTFTGGQERWQMK
jgi:hypothetical protein